MRSRRPRRLSPYGYRRFGFRRGFFLGCLLGALLSLAAFSLVPLVAFVFAALGIAFLVARRVFAELTPRDRLLLN